MLLTCDDNGERIELPHLFLGGGAPELGPTIIAIVKVGYSRLC